VTEIFRRVLSEIGDFHPAEMKKRRQSMPNTRGSSYSDIEVKALELLARKHAADKKSYARYLEMIMINVKFEIDRD
ncbi:hypothetical protein WUBG_13656, partial [Wuchereria bancrofti]